MGHAGRPAKPAALKVLEGRSGAGQAIDEPKPRPVAPKAPGWLSPAARRIWRELEGDLERSGLLTVVDGAIFGSFCEAFAEARRLRTWLRQNGETYIPKDGTLHKVRPQVAIFNAERRTMLACAAELGMTPAARKRMAVLINSGGDSSLDDLLD